MHVAEAIQGHRYRLGSRDVLAMQSGVIAVEVRELTGDYAAPLGRREVVKSSWLEPAPMSYFSGEVPE